MGIIKNNIGPFLAKVEPTMNFLNHMSKENIRKIELDRSRLV